MPTIRQRVKAFLNPTNSNKNIWQLAEALNSYSGLGAGGILQDNKFGYAKAYLSVMAVRQAVDYYATSSQDVPSKIIRNTTGEPEDDEVIAESTDVIKRHVLYDGFKHHRLEHGINAISAMVYNTVLYDELYCYKVKGKTTTGKKYAQVLNTLGVTVRDELGYISGYDYSWNNEHQYIRPDDMAYSHGFNPVEDYRGASIVQSAISKIRIEDNLDAFLQSFFKNNASIGLVGSPAINPNNPLASNLSQEELTQLRKIVNDWHIGVRNAFKPLITNIPIDWSNLPIPDIEKNYGVGKDINFEVLTAFGVNPALVGYTDGTSYKEDIPQIEAQFVNKKLRPVLSIIQDLINDDILPFVDNSGGLRFEFDYDGYQLVTEQDVINLDMRTTQLNSGGLALNDYIAANGGETLDEFDDLYIYDGVPVPKDEIPNLWRYKFLVAPSVFNSEVITGEPLPQPASPDDVILTSAGSEPVSDEQLNTKMFDTLEPLDLDAIFSELTVWRKKAKAGLDFIPYKSIGLLSDMVYEADTELDGVNKAMDYLKDFQRRIAYDYEGKDSLKSVIQQKSIQSTRIDFEIAIEDLINEARNETIDQKTFTLRMMQSIRGYGQIAMLDGLAAGGVVTTLADLEADDTAFLNRHFIRQRSFVNKLGQVIFGKGLSDAEAARKPILWFNKSIAPLFEAGKASADKNGMYEWVLGNTEQHCRTCKALDGQRHRMKTYFSRNLIPQSDILECGGWHCDCKLIQVFGKARGRLPKV